jgi:hypothetical protein
MGIYVVMLRVFTDAAGDFGNRLRVVDAAAVPAPWRQALATELGYSETVFVDLPAAGAITQGRGSQILTTWYPEGWVAVHDRVVSACVRHLGAQPPSTSAPSGWTPR